MGQPAESSSSEQGVELVPDAFPSTLLYIAIGAAVIPFMFSMSNSSSVTENGLVTQSSYTDPVALLGGAVAAVCGLWGLSRFKRVEKHRVRTALIVNGLVLGVGVFHLLRGKGFV